MDQCEVHSSMRHFLKARQKRASELKCVIFRTIQHGLPSHRHSTSNQKFRALASYRSPALSASMNIVFSWLSLCQTAGVCPGIAHTFKYIRIPSRKGRFRPYHEKYETEYSGLEYGQHGQQYHRRGDRWYLNLYRIVTIHICMTSADSDVRSAVNGCCHGRRQLRSLAWHILLNFARTFAFNGQELMGRKA